MNQVPLDLCTLLIAALIFQQTFGLSIAGENSSQRNEQTPAMFRGRRTPYVEKYDEKILRRLWESSPFFVISQVLEESLNNVSTIRPLRRQPPFDETEPGYHRMFDRIYSTTQPSQCLPDTFTPLANEKKKNFLILLAYRGTDFCGWQTQPGNDQLPSIQKSLEEWLSELEGSRVDVRVCGRTDAGVHAIGQVARFRSSLPEIEVSGVESHMEKLPMRQSLKCLGVTPVGKNFHPTFAAETRAYTYMVDTDSWDGFRPEMVDVIAKQLKQLEGKALDYIGLSYGKVKTQNTICTLYHCDAVSVEDSTTGKNALCIELVGDRFLRRMVRILVGTCLGLAVQLEMPPPDALLQIVAARDRCLSGKAAPPDGLIFIGATFRG